VGQAADDDNFNEKIQDIGTVQTDTTKKVFSVQYGNDSNWLGFRRHASKLI